jgi:hypothetical protein
MVSKLLQMIRVVHPGSRGQKGTRSRNPYPQHCYPHRGVDVGHSGCRTTEYKSTDSPFPHLLNVMYCVRVSLRTVKILPAHHQREGGRGLSLFISVLSLFVLVCGYFTRSVFVNGISV